MTLSERIGFGQQSKEIDRDCIKYPRTEFQYSRTSTRINVLDGKGVLVIQTSGKDENNRVNPDVVAKFQSVIIGENLESFVVPAGSWHLFYKSIGHRDLVTEIVCSTESPVEQSERYVPYPAYEVVRQNGELALLPTLRVGEVKSVSSGGIPYAQQRYRSLTTQLGVAKTS